MRWWQQNEPQKLVFFASGGEERGGWRDMGGGGLGQEKARAEPADCTSLELMLEAVEP